MLEPRNENITIRTDKKTAEWFRSIAENEGRSISNVGHLALKKVKDTFRQNEVTRENGDKIE